MMRFGPRFNQILKRDFLIITAIWLVPYTIVPLICTVVNLDFEAILQLLSPEFGIVSTSSKYWTLIYLFAVAYLIVSWYVNCFHEKRADFGDEEKKYYRDIVSNVTPSQLSYIDDYGIEVKKEIVATILMLKIKNKLQIKKDGIKLNENTDYNGLLKSEEHIMKCLEKGYSPFREKLHFKNLLMEDLLNSGLIEKETTISLQFLYEMIRWGVYGIILVIFSIFVPIDICQMVFRALGLVVFIFTFLCYWSASTFSTYNKLTLKGKNIHEKLNGLRLFLKDYSNMKNKSLNELELWDEYMLYSIILNDNKKVQKEVLKIIDKTNNHLQK